MKKQIFLIIFFVQCLFLVSSCNEVKPIPFDSKVWKEEANTFTTSYSYNSGLSRPGMARDLINRNSLVGKNAQEIEELLGKPYAEEQNNKYVYKTEEQIFSIEPQRLELLYIIFGKEKTVEKVEIRTIKFR